MTMFIAIQPGENDENYASQTGTIGRSGMPPIPGAGDMMTEMAKRLQERRRKAEGLTDVSITELFSHIITDIALYIF